MPVGVWVPVRSLDHRKVIALYHSGKAHVNAQFGSFGWVLLTGKVESAPGPTRQGSWSSHPIEARAVGDGQGVVSGRLLLSKAAERLATVREWRRWRGEQRLSRRRRFWVVCGQASRCALRSAQWKMTRAYLCARGVTTVRVVTLCQPPCGAGEELCFPGHRIGARKGHRGHTGHGLDPSDEASIRGVTSTLLGLEGRGSEEPI